MEDGVWYSELTIFNGDTIQEKDSFKIEKLEDKNGFEEQWSIYVGDNEYVSALVIRAFDNSSKTWSLYYVDDLNAHIGSVN